MNVFNDIYLYEAMIKYAKIVVYTNKSKTNPIDLVHDLIIQEDINNDNYRNKIKSLFFTEVRSKDKGISSFAQDNAKGFEKVIESIPCKKCQESYPPDFFRNRLLKNGFVQIYYICKRCESKDCGDRQKRTDKTNELTHKQKQHIKMKATDPNYLKRKVIAMQEYRKRKALEKTLT